MRWYRFSNNFTPIVRSSTITYRAIRALLRLVAATVLVVSVMILAYAFRPPPLPADGTMPKGQQSVAASKNVFATRELEEFVPIWERQLGTPLYDPPPKVIPPEVTPVVPAPRVRSQAKAPKVRQRDKGRGPASLRVIGTVIEQGKSVAMLTDSEGSIQLRGVGETFSTPHGEVRVERIETDRVTILVGDELTTLKMP